MRRSVWVFDVDGTLVDSLTGTSLRPGAEELLIRLRSEGCSVFLWSAGGADYARQRAEQHRIDLLFDAFHGKDDRDVAGSYIAKFLDAPLDATYVDDRPEDLPVGADIITVSPYLASDEFDRGLARALA